MVKKIFLTLTAMCLINTGMIAQQNWCGSDHVLEQWLNESPENRAAFEAQEEAIQAYQMNGSAARAETKYIIPVVVHVLYSECDGNISMEQIQDGLRVLNEDFNRQNDDASFTREQFVDVAANSEIEFRLATIDPSGNPTNGVNRVQTPQAVEAQDHVKPLSRWPYKEYYNIWVVETIENFTGSGGTILGYAYFPGAGNNYGMLIRNDAFGTIGTSSADGRTLTHEVGHSLDLYHTFNDGCGNSCATSGDGVCDTPPAAGATYNCSFSTNTCNNDASGPSTYSSDVTDMIENYMSYNSCQNLFTEGQKTRMHAALETDNALKELTSDENLIATGVAGPSTTDFTTTSYVVCRWNSVNFSDASMFEIDSREWEFGGSAFPAESTDESPSVTFPIAGLHEVSYQAQDGTGSGTATKEIFVISDEGQYAPFKDDLEAATQIPSDNWYAINIDDDEYKWKISNEAAVSGSKSIKMDNYGSCGQRSDVLITQSYDLSPYSSYVVSFKQAFARTSGSNSDNLQFFVSHDCGQTWDLVWVESGFGLTSVNNSVSTPFAPDPDEWNNISITLDDPEFLQEGIVFKFEFVSGGGNNLYLDDFGINGTFSGDLLLREPKNGKGGLASDVTVDWKAVGFVESYEFQIDKNANFDSPDLITGTTEYMGTSPVNSDTEFMAEDLDLSTTYYWRVRYVQAGNTSDWSEIWSFTISEDGVGINNTKIQNDIKVFPNPATEQVTVISSEGLSAIQIYDYMGRMVSATNLLGDKNTAIQTNELSSGIYILRIEMETGSTETKQLVIR